VKRATYSAFVCGGWQPPNDSKIACYTQRDFMNKVLRRHFMIERQLILITALLLTLTTACKTNQSAATSNTGNSPPATSSPDQFAAVRPIYEKECQSCHGANGAGGPVKLEDGSKLKVPTLREGHAVRHGDDEFTKQITKGGDGMPAFDTKLSTNQTNDLIRMIRVEFQGK
jgi:mono/diheme cytochrome c family protein